MKHFFISLLLVLSSLISNSQSTHKAFMTEMYLYNSKTEDWELYQKNSDIDINIVIDGEFINFQALMPTMYRIYPDTKELIKTTNLTGVRYKAKELKEDKEVYIDIVRGTSGKFMLSIINPIDGYNFRYYLR